MNSHFQQSLKKFEFYKETYSNCTFQDERIKLEPKEAEGQFSQISSPDRLRIDEMRSGSSHEEINTSVNDIHRKSPSEITAEQQFNGSTRTTSPMSSLPNSMHSSLGIFHKEIMKSMVSKKTFF